MSRSATNLLQPDSQVPRPRREWGVQRAYNRLGARLLIACQAVNVVAGWLLTSAFVFGYLRFTNAGQSVEIRIYTLWACEYLAACCIANVAIFRAAQPVTRWIDGGRPVDAAGAAWSAAIRLPTVTGAWYAGALLAEVPLNAYMTNRIHPYGGGAAGAITESIVHGIGVSLLAGAVMLITRAAVRPLLLDVATALGNNAAPPRGGLSVRARLMLLTPAMFFIPLFAGAGAAIQPESGMPHAMAVILVGLALTAAFGIPFALLLASSTLQPLDDLLDATRRLREGDLTTRVQAVSDDEHGELARTFNEAMIGLAEREVLAVQNEQLLEDVRASRARIVAASDAERTRIERNLHDGAQQRLVALALDLRVIQGKAAAGHDVGPDMERAQAALKAALEEVRELARGLHPSVLTTDGLRPAISALANRCTTPIVVNVPNDRLPAPVESTIYFLVSEAVTNVDKHAAATHVTVTVAPDGDHVAVEIADDGRGGAEPASGTGLIGLADRVAAASGTLTIDSPPGQGTRLRAELPTRGPGIRTGTDPLAEPDP